MRIFAATLVVGFIGASAAFAQTAEIDCDAAMLQREMNICAYQDYQAADAALNAMYQQSMARAKEYGNGSDDALRAAQRAWIPYRDAACAAESQLFEGGSMQPLIEHSCMASLTERRTEDMRAAYEAY